MKTNLSNKEKQAVLAVCLCLFLYIILPFIIARFFPPIEDVCRKYSFFSMIMPGILLYTVMVFYAGDFFVRKTDFQGIDIAKISGLGLLMLPVNAIGTGLWMALLKFMEIKFDTNVPVENFIMSCCGLELAGAGIFICILTPLIEESVFRRVIYEGLKEHCPPVFSIAAASLLFALLHGILFQLFSLFVLGVYFQILYCREEKLGASIYAHFFNNTIAFLMILLLKYIPSL